MRKAALYGLVIACLCMLFALSGPSAQKIAPEPSAPVSRPAQVEVTNFPAVQQVAGIAPVRPAATRSVFPRARAPDRCYPRAIRGLASALPVMAWDAATGLRSL
jgi:hypothetical protein